MPCFIPINLPPFPHVSIPRSCHESDCTVSIAWLCAHVALSTYFLHLLDPEHLSRTWHLTGDKEDKPNPICPLLYIDALDLFVDAFAQYKSSYEDPLMNITGFLIFQKGAFSLSKWNLTIRIPSGYRANSILAEKQLFCFKRVPTTWVWARYPAGQIAEAFLNHQVEPYSCKWEQPTG